MPAQFRLILRVAWRSFLIALPSLLAGAKRIAA
jgi:hypothetical protein